MEWWNWMTSFFVGGKPPEEILIDLKLASKQLSGQSKRCGIEAKKEEARVGQALKNKNPEAARIHASNVIRKRQEAANLLRLASRVDGLASRFGSALARNTVTSSMASLVQEMDRAVAADNLGQMMETVDRFERTMEDGDLAGEVIASAIDRAAATTAPADEVEALMMEVGEQVGIEVQLQLAGDTMPREETEVLVGRLAELRRAAEEERDAEEQQQQEKHHAGRDGLKEMEAA